MKQIKIHTDKEEVLHEKCLPVTLPVSDELRETILAMVDYLKKSQDPDYAEKKHVRPGVGLAAPQIGIDQRFFAISFEDGGKKYEYGLVNPVILSSSVKRAYLKNGEGCLSVPEDVPGHVYRYFRITLEGYDVVSDRMVTLKLSGYPAIVFQHEYDHLDGVLYYERIDANDPFKEDPEAVAIE